MPKDITKRLGVRAEHHVTRRMAVAKEVSAEDWGVNARSSCEIPDAMP